MGKKKYNWKARNNIEVIIDNSVTKKIPIDIIHREDNFDSCNALVLPNEKRKTKKKIKNTVITRLLSKKRRKQLEKVIEKKKKKLQRTELLKELVEVQASPEELKQYVSLTSVQTKGLKRHFREAELSVKEYKIDSNIKNKNDTIEMPINAIRASKKKRLAILEKEVIEKTISDLNVIGFDESSNSELESDTKNNEDEQKEDATNIVSLEKNKIKEKNEHISNKKNDLIDGNVTKNTIEEEKKSIVTLTKKSLKPQQLIEKKSALFVMLQRKPEIQAARLKLPIVAEEQIIMEVINENPVVIITGETGSGKTTQVPQFLYEAGYAQEKLIGITEPRRVAAISMSKRVAQEMNLSEKEVSYLIRFEGNVTPETKIKFMTDGVLLKEIQNDFLLTKYSIIILDEAHERSVYTDILIGLLSRIVPLRNKRKNSLKLVIMSATLRVEEFVENNKLFKMKPPVLTVESRQFPVTIHFNKTTSINYISDALKKAIKIHTRLPDGGILIFLTGQREVNFVVRKLRQAFSTRNKKEITKKIEKSENKDFSKKKEDIQDKNDNNKNDNIDSDNDFCYKKAIRYNKLRQKKHIQLPNINLDDYSVIPIDDTYEDLIAAEDDEEEQLDESEDEDMINPKICINAQPLWVLPLYSLLPSHKQARVFEPPPEGHRLCVVSTNVAETSLTIPNIKYVIDCGRCKIKMYDKVTGVNTYKVYYTSKASANQRAGRAGRTGPGHCYRLYSSAMFNDHFEQFSQSEIQRKPVDDLILQMKIMNIDKVVNFPFPTPPDATQLKMAEKRLIILGILEQPAIEKKDLYSAKVTSLGRSIAAFPVAPRYGKMLALSHQHNLLQYTVCMVAALSVQEIFMETFDIDVDSRNKWLQIKRFWAGTGNSLLLGDLMVLIRAVGSAEYAGTKGKLFSFCEEHGLRHKAIVEIRKLRQQLTNEINLNIQDLNLIIDPQMKPPVDMEAKLLRQIVLAGMADQVAKKVMPDEINEDQDKTKWKYAYKTVDMEDPVFLHSSCVLRKICPEWVVYQEIYETNKMYMRGVTAIESEWLPKFAPSLCQLGDPLTNPPPRYDPETGKIMCSITGTFGRAGWKLPIMNMEYPLSIDGVKWFACFFLEGKVFPKLKQFVSSLLSTPQSITKAWAKLIPRTQEMTQLLLSHGIMSKVQLLETWKADRNFLLSAYQKWLPESMHGHIMIIWPPI
ncbi:probable ATP-dependent RNA helicase kurz isoform X1 [Apis laboriosa]|uniref:probable ATP-dependent RNA helicase kurz isoform X1 n=1 Tax=Apis laboriosa TaxID=183418 RepID=UPI001CC3543D|nr:probable ATP-dependent RNA helicase kurz isoform X1 [Apis laboriosa]